MIPLSDNNPARTTPYIVYLIIAVNVFIFIIDKFTGNGPLGSLWNFSMIPQSVIHNIPVEVAVGKDQSGNIVTFIHQGLSPQWLTLFTSMFMHSSFMHIGSNMLYLWIFGNNIEDALGHFKFLMFYLLSGALAGIAHIIANPTSVIPTVGASGAIAAVLGAYLLLYPGAKIKTLVTVIFFITIVELPAIVLLGLWFFTQLMGIGGSGGLQGGGVAYWAHIGGFVVGIPLVIMLRGKSNKHPNRDNISHYLR